METDKFKTQVFLVLVPHRDARGEIRKYAESLHKNGLKGVYNFPYVSPAALLTKPFTPDELKTAAKLLRETANGEKFQSTELSHIAFGQPDSSMLLFGHKLNNNLSPAAVTCAEKKIINQITPAIIGSYLIPKTCEKQLCALMSLCESHSLPVFSFRAAAVANMFWRPVNENGGIIYKWRIGKLFWLPKTLKK